MKPITTISDSILRVAPRLSVRGSLQLMRLGDINGFDDGQGRAGELLTGAFLCDTPVVTRRASRQYTLINHDHPALAEQLSSLSMDATLWVFLLDSDDAELTEKIRLFNIVSAVRSSKTCGDRLTKQLLSDIGETPRYQRWLSDHLGLKLYERGDRCPVNIASLAEILGMRNHTTISDHVRAGWGRYTHTDGDSNADTDARQAEDKNVSINNGGGHIEEDAVTKWNAFAKEQITSDFDTWYKHLEQHGELHYPQRFAQRVSEYADDKGQLLTLLDNITKAVGTPNDT